MREREIFGGNGELSERHKMTAKIQTNIVIKIGEKEISLSLGEARELHGLLDEMFGGNPETAIVPVPVPQPQPAFPWKPIITSDGTAPDTGSVTCVLPRPDTGSVTT